MWFIHGSEFDNSSQETVILIWNEASDKTTFWKLFNDVNDSSFLINIDDNVEIQYKIPQRKEYGLS